MHKLLARVHITQEDVCTSLSNRGRRPNCGRRWCARRGSGLRARWTNRASTIWCSYCCASSAMRICFRVRRRW
ncbi:hypothetical protein BXO454_19700, partial [Xanthomonas oryzae pv. oryzae]